MKYNENLHIHSTLSGCASNDMTIDAIIAKAWGCSISTIAITNHIDNPKTRMHRGQQLIKGYDNIRDRIKMLNDIQVLLGCETTQTNPNEFSADNITASKMDIVLVSSNHYHLKYVDRPIDTSPKGYSNHYLSMVKGALDWEYTDVIAHPFYLHKLGGIDHVLVLKSYDRGRLKDILALASNRGIAFELCPRHFRDYPDFFVELVSYGHDLGTKFSIGSDAHNLNQICYGEKDISNLGLLGIEKGDIYDGARKKIDEE